MFSKSDCFLLLALYSVCDSERFGFLTISLGFYFMMYWFSFYMYVLMFEHWLLQGICLFILQIGNTPLIRLNAASEATGCEIYGKAEFLNPGGSVKDRAALYIIKVQNTWDVGVFKLQRVFVTPQVNPDEPWQNKLCFECRTTYFSNSLDESPCFIVRDCGLFWYQMCVFQRLTL